MGRAAHADAEASISAKHTPVKAHFFIMASLYHIAMTKR
jgi:hypothetical protein